MKKLSLILLAVLAIFILGSCQQPLEVGTPVPADGVEKIASPAVSSEVIAYFCDWSIYAGHDQYRVSKIPFDKLTIINFSFLSIVDDVHNLFDGFKQYTQTKFNRTVQKYEAAWLDKNADIDQTFGDPSIPWGSDYAGCIGQLNYYKEQYPHIKVVPSIGGWTKGHMFSEMAANPAARAIFVESCVTLAREYGFDGVDIDWEYPGIDRTPDPNDSYDWGCPGQPADTQNFTILMKELREAFDAASAADNKDYIVTAAVGIGYDKFAKTEVDKYPQYLDYINLMTYDMHGAWDSVAGHQAPIKVTANGPYDADIRDKYNVEYAIQQFLDAGVSAAKLTLGVPFYSRGWSGVPVGDDPALPGLYETATGSPVGKWDNPSTPGGQHPYFEIKKMVDAGTLSVYHDPVADASYAYGSNGEFYTFDTASQIRKKVELAMAKNLGGIMIWEIDGDTWQDGSYELTNTIFDALGGNIRPPTPTPTPTTCGCIDPTPTPTATIPSIPAWDASAAYNGGAKVSYNGKIWEAKWWTQGDEPGANQWGPWNLIGDIINTPTPTSTPSYTPTPVETADDVLYSFEVRVSEYSIIQPPNPQILIDGVPYDMGTITLGSPKTIEVYEAPGDSYRFGWWGWSDGVNEYPRTISASDNITSLELYYVADPTPTPSQTPGVTFQPNNSYEFRATFVGPYTSRWVTLINPVDNTPVEGVSISVSHTSRYGFVTEIHPSNANGEVMVEYNFPHYDYSIQDENFEITFAYENETLTVPAHFYDGMVDLPTPTPTPTATIPVYPAWEASAVYNAGDMVTHNNLVWKAAWWTTGEEPGTTGQWGAWRQQ